MEKVEFGVPVCRGGGKQEQNETKPACLFFIVGLVIPPTPPKLKIRPFGNFPGHHRGPCTAGSAECHLGRGTWAVRADCSASSRLRGQREVWSPLTLRWGGEYNPAFWISDSKGWGSLWVGLDEKVAKPAKFCDNSLPSANRGTELSLFDRRAAVQEWRITQVPEITGGGILFATSVFLFKRPEGAMHLTALTLRAFLGAEPCSQPRAQERKVDAEVKTLHPVSLCCVIHVLPGLFSCSGALVEMLNK